MEFVRYYAQGWKFRVVWFLFGLVIFFVLNIWLTLSLPAWIIGWVAGDLIFKGIDYAAFRPKVTTVHDDGMHVYEKEE